jgi:hypothetical protein
MAARVEQHPRPDREELVLYGLVAAIGTIPVVIALVAHEGFGLDATLGLLMMLIGLAGIVVQLARTRRSRSR